MVGLNCKCYRNDACSGVLPTRTHLKEFKKSPVQRLPASTNCSSKQRSPLHVAWENRPSQQQNPRTHWRPSSVDTRLQQMARHRLLHHKTLQPDDNDALQHRFERPTPEGHPPAASPNKMPRNHQAFSLRNRRTLIARPFGAEYPPSAPFAATTR